MWALGYFQSGCKPAGGVMSARSADATGCTSLLPLAAYQDLLAAPSAG